MRNEDDLNKNSHKSEEKFNLGKEFKTEDIKNLTPEKIGALIHDLQVHQIEIETQNEELKRIQVELDSTKANYFEIYDLAPVGYIIISDKGLILNSNLTAATMLGTIRKDIVKKGLSHYILKEDQDIYYLHQKRLFETREPQECEIRMHKKDGTIFWGRLKATVAKSDDSFVCRATLDDITERKRLEKEKVEMYAHLNQQQRLESIGTLAGGVAHEINNPINGIMNYGQLILDSSTADEENYEYAKEIVRESNRIAIIVRNLLHFSRDEKQTNKFTYIKEIIESTLSLIKTVIQHDQIDLQIEFSDNLPLLKCRSQQIQQVLMNLLTNARDALNEKYKGYNKDKIIKVYSKQITRDKLKWIRITVEDHGNGIPEDIQEKIFDPFFTSKGRDRGTGLGLYISHGIVEEHNGQLSFDSKEGKYTKFYLDLPVTNG